jgi:Tfp pilus assembly protein PilO
MKNNETTSSIFLKYKNLLIMVVVVVLISLSWNLVSPQVEKISTGRANLQKEEARQKLLQAKYDDLSGLNEFELTERNALTLKAIPETKNVFGAMITIKTLANENNIMISEIKVDPGDVSSESAQKVFTNVSFTLKIDGSYKEVIEFLKKTETTLPLMTLGKFKTTTNGETASAEFSLDTPFYPMPQELGKIDTPLAKLTTDEDKLLETLAGFTYLEPISFTPAEGRADPFSN